MKISDKISLTLPLKAEYVSIARLTASGIASQAGFDIDTVEDIKVSISEVIGKMIEKCPPESGLSIDFNWMEDGLTICLMLPGQKVPEIFEDDEDNLALAIISSLMDQVDIRVDNDRDITAVKMVKKLGKAV